MIKDRPSITLSNATIGNPDALEYQWVRELSTEGYAPSEINHYIHTCFGGDMVFADLFRKVAIQEESIYLIMQYVGCAPSSREF